MRSRARRTTFPTAEKTVSGPKLYLRSRRQYLAHPDDADIQDVVLLQWHSIEPGNGTTFTDAILRLISATGRE